MVRKSAIPSTELGRGHIDYNPIFAAAKKTEVELYYVEQEPPFTTTPAMEAIKMDCDYLQGDGVSARHSSSG